MDENLPIITESAFNSQFGGTDLGTIGLSSNNAIQEDLPVIKESEFNSMASSPTWGQSAKYIGRNVVAGAGDLLGMVADYGAGTSQGMLPTELKNSTRIKNLLTNIFGSAEAEDNNLSGIPVEVAGAVTRGSVIPGGQVANALASGGAKLGEELFPDSTAAPILGAVGGAGLVGAAKGLANVAQTTGKAFERSSLGVTAAKYVKSMKVNGLLDDAETGELSTRLSKAINDIGDTEGWGLLRNPERLAQRNQAVLDDVGEKIGTTLELASATGAKPVVDFTSPNSAVGKLIGGAKAEKKQIKEAFNEFLDGFTDPTDGWAGDITSLNQWKSSIQNQAFSGSAKGSLAAPVQRKLQRAIANDIKSAVDKGVVDSGVTTADDWAKTMALYGRHAEVAPILNEGVAKGLGGSIDKALRGALRTSGGVLTTPTMIAGTIGGIGAGPVGLAAGLGLGALASPTGSGIAGNVLKTGGKVLGALTKGDKKIAAITGLLNNVLSDSKQPEKKAEPELKQQLKKVLGDSDLTPRSSDMAVNPIVSQFEGGQRLKAYAPPAKGSGVTVGTGIDLGRRSKAELKELDLPESLIEKVAPYLGKKDSEATSYLKKNPLNLSQEEADALDTAIGENIFNKVSAKYTDATGQDLSSLPEEARTVIESVAYNFGPNLDTKLPSFWKHVVNNDWEGMHDFLISTRWKQPELSKRRYQEAALLTPLLDQVKA